MFLGSVAKQHFPKFIGGDLSAKFCKFSSDRHNGSYSLKTNQSKFSLNHKTILFALT